MPITLAWQVRPSKKKTLAARGAQAHLRPFVFVSARMPIYVFAIVAVSVAVVVAVTNMKMYTPRPTGNWQLIWPIYMPKVGDDTRRGPRSVRTASQVRAGSA